MCTLKEEGLVKSIGVSNYRISDLEKVSRRNLSRSRRRWLTCQDRRLEQTLDGAEHPIAVNQIEYHPFVYERAQSLVEFSESRPLFLRVIALTP